MKFPKFGNKKQLYIVPTRYGFLYGGLVLFLLYAAIDFGNPPLIFMIAVLFTVALVSMYVTHSNLENLDILDAQLDSGFSGEDIDLRIRVKSRNALPLASIEIQGTLKDIPPHGGRSFFIPVRLKKRGPFQIEEMKLSTVYPFGLFYAWTYWEHPLHCFAYPKKLSLKEFQSIILKNSTSPDAQQEDFLGHRRALPSDSARRIDWKIFARSQILKTKIFDSPSAQNPILTWDNTPGDHTEAKLSFLATTIDELHKMKTPYGLVLPNIQFKTESGNNHYHQCLRALSEFQAPSGIE